MLDPGINYRGLQDNIQTELDLLAQFIECKKSLEEHVEIATNTCELSV